LRMMQVLGVYGRTGLGEGKEYFQNGILPAVKNLNMLLEQGRFPVKVPELESVVLQLKSYDKESRTCLLN